MNISSHRAVYRSIRTYLRIENFPAASEALKKIKYAKDPYAYVFKMLYDHAHGRPIDKSDANRLSKEHENEWIRKAKIVLGSELELSDIELQLNAGAEPRDFSRERSARPTNK